MQRAGQWERANGGGRKQQAASSNDIGTPLALRGVPIGFSLLPAARGLLPPFSYSAVTAASRFATAPRRALMFSISTSIEKPIAK